MIWCFFVKSRVGCKLVVNCWLKSVSDDIDWLPQRDLVFVTFCGVYATAVSAHKTISRPYRRAAFCREQGLERRKISSLFGNSAVNHCRELSDADRKFKNSAWPSSPRDFWEREGERETVKRCVDCVPSENRV